MKSSAASFFFFCFVVIISVLQRLAFSSHFYTLGLLSFSLQYAFLYSSLIFSFFPFVEAILLIPVIFNASP